MFDGFSSEDFDAYLPEKWSSNVFTLPRRKVKDKLDFIGRRLFEEFQAYGLALNMHLSDDHPSLWNKKKVDTQWLFFSRDEEARKKLAEIIDTERTLATTLIDPTPLYRHVFLGVSVNRDHVEIGLWLHHEAWVDRKNLTALLKDDDFRARFDEIKGIITLVDGTLLPALPTLVEAMWQDDKHKAFKLHTHFELLKGVPTRMDLTEANASERDVLERSLQPDRVYVMDRGYAKFGLFRRIMDLGPSFVCRIRDNSVFEVLEARPLSAEATEAGLVRDLVVRFTGDQAAKAGLDRPMRILEVKCKPHRKSSGKTGRGGPEQGDIILIATDILDVPAEVIALIYKHRWAIETFFRFFKHVLGCRHLLSHCPNGIEIQTYLAIIACLLIALWTGRKPTLRTYEMICHYFTGLATEEELLAHIEKLAPQS